jgi:hypothetical protein
MSDWAMLQFRHPGEPPSIDEVAGRFNLRPEEIDRNYGVVASDPVDGLYVVLVDPAAQARIDAALAAQPADPATGVFSNPRVEPTEPE